LASNFHTRFYQIPGEEQVVPLLVLQRASPSRRGKCVCGNQHLLKRSPCPLNEDRHEVSFKTNLLPLVDEAVAEAEAAMAVHHSLSSKWLWFSIQFSTFITIEHGRGVFGEDRILKR